MNKTRIKAGKNLSIDLAAMCDVALLLLVFFLATSTFKPWEPIIINLPSHTNMISDPDIAPTTILVSQDRVMFEIPDEKMRAKALAKMAKKHNAAFTAAELAKFNGIDIIGTPVGELKQYIDGYYNKSSFLHQPGLSSVELRDWISQTKLASQELGLRSPLFVIKADKAAPYPMIQAVISVLQNQHINHFSLLTNTR